MSIKLTSWDKKRQKFSNNEMSLVATLIIGDGHLTKSGRLVIAHGKQQKDYCEWKATKISEILGQNVTANPTRQCFQVQVSRKAWQDVWYKAYQNGRKNILGLLTYINNPIEAAAIWICDDGNVCPSINSKNGKCYSAAIQIFTFTELEESIEIANWFESKLGVRPNVHFRDRSKTNRKSAYILKFSAENSRKLFSIIKPYIPNIESMKYKFRYLEK